MTDPAGTIGRAADPEPGATYHALLTEAIAMVQTMAGDVWTDYNYADPGVTILEQLAYALTELPYRARLPVADFLADPDTSRVALRRHAMFPAWSILPCNPVTVADWRRLLLDRVAGLANVWLVPSGAADRNTVVQGLYDIRILSKHDADQNAALIDHVRHCFVAHRALAEDVANIEVLRPIETLIEANIEIAHGADADDALAQGLFALGLALAPEPSRLPLADWQVLRPETTAVFSGPLMLHGFIVDDQLGPAPASFTADSLTEVLAAAPGVLTVDALTIRLDDLSATYAGATAIHVPDGCVLALWTGPLANRRFPITVTRRGARITPDATRVVRKLKALWANHRKTWRLRREYIAAYGAPGGDYADLAAYTSVQTQFPLIYAIGEGAIAAGAPLARHGAAKQLKGYLMAFDQLLADTFAQMAFTRTLMSIDGDPGGATYAWQSLRPIAPGVAPLLHHDYAAKLAELVGRTDPAVHRQGEVLDLLMGMLGLHWVLPLSSLSASSLRGVDASAAQIKARQTMLRQAVPATRDRGRGLNYLRKRNGRGPTGAERASRIELDLVDHEHGSGHGWPIVRDRLNGLLDFAYPPDQWEPVEALLVLVAADDLGDEGGARDADDLAFVASRRILPELLLLTRHADAYRIGLNEEDGTHTLACRDPAGDWWLIARTDSMEQALRLLRGLRLAGDRQWHNRLHLVDWILLRHAALPDVDPRRFAMRLTAVLSGPAADQSHAWKQRASSILRANIPAHIALDFLYPGPAALAEFELLHAAWRLALACRGQNRLATASRRLAGFLLKHLPPEQDKVPDAAPAEPAAETPPAEPAAPANPPRSAEPAPPPPPAEKPDAPLPEDMATRIEHVEVVLEQDVQAVEAKVVPWLASLVQRIIGPLLRLIPTAARASTAPEPTPTPPPIPSVLAAAPPEAAPDPEPAPAAAPPQSRPRRQAVAAPPGARGFDCNTILSSGSAKAFRDHGFSFAVRYLSRGAPGTNDLSASEVSAVVDAGLALMAVQHVPAAGWHPSLALARTYAAAASSQAKACALPPGMCLWLDLEGVAHGTATADIVAYCNAWFDIVRSNGFQPGLYVGANCGLDGKTLGTALACEHFWRSGSTVPDVAGRGYCMVQTISSNFVLAGIAYDLDVIQTDAKGSTPFWAIDNTQMPMAPSPSSAPAFPR